MIEVKVTYKDMTPQLLKDLQAKQISLVTQGGSIIQGAQASRAPRDTGNLVNSIQTESFIEDGRAVSETGATAKHAVYVEYGTGVYAKDGQGRKTPWTYQDELTGEWIRTHGMEAQPFAEPGFQAAKPRIDDLAEKVLRA